MNKTFPKKYKGREFTVTKGNNIYKCREWNSKEDEFLKYHLSIKTPWIRIAYLLDRSKDSIEQRIKKSRKKDCSYNNDHAEEKMQKNIEFLNIIQPKSMLDVFAGINGSVYKQHISYVVDNDFNPNANTQNHLDASKIVAREYANNNKYDIVDLDTYGCAISCFEQAIHIAKKGIIITFGELKQKRFKNYVYFLRRYGFKSMEEATLKNMMEYVIILGQRCKKILIPEIICEWRTASRVWFKIEKM